MEQKIPQHFNQAIIKKQNNQSSSQEQQQQQEQQISSQPIGNSSKIERVVQKNWLAKFKMNTKVYFEYLNAAFLALQNEQELNLPLSVSPLEMKQSQVKELDDIRNTFILFESADMERFLFLKKSSIFSSDLLRYLVLYDGKLSQSKTLTDAPSKPFMMPSIIVIEKMNDSDKSALKINAKLTQKLYLSIRELHKEAEQHITVYCADLAQAQKVRDKIRYFKVLNKYGKDSIIKLLTKNVYLQYYTQFRKLFQKNGSQPMNKKYPILAQFDLHTNIKGVLLWKEKAYYKKLKGNQQNDPKIQLLQNSILIQNFDRQVINQLCHEWLINAPLILEQSKYTQILVFLKFKEMELDEKISFYKPMILIEFQANKDIDSKETSIIRKVNGIQKKFEVNHQQQQQQFVYFSATYIAQLNKKVNNGYYVYSLKEHENQFESSHNIHQSVQSTPKSSTQNMNNRSYISASNLNNRNEAQISFKISDIGLNDHVYIKFYDGLDISQPNQVTVEKIFPIRQFVNETLLNREMWYNVGSTSKKNPEQLNLLKIENLFLPNFYCENFKGQSHEEFLDYLIINKLNFVDPIYPDLIFYYPLKSTQLYNTVQILQESNKSDSNNALSFFNDYIVNKYHQNQAVLRDVLRILVNQINQDLCKQISEVSQQVEILSVLGQKSSEYYSTCKNLQESMCLFIQKFKTTGDKIQTLKKNMEQLFKLGLPCFYRYIFWYNLLNTDQLVSQWVKQNSIKNSENARDAYLELWSQGEKANEIHYFDHLQQMDQQNQTKKAFHEPSFLAKLSNILNAYLQFSRISDNVQEEKQENYIFFVIQKISKKILSLSSQYYLPSQDMVDYHIIQEDEEPIQELLNENFAFWMLVQIVQKIGNQTLVKHDYLSLKQELVELEIILTELMPQFIQTMIDKKIDIIQELSYHLLSLFVDLFPSEYLFRIWDIFFWEAYNGVEEQKYFRFSVIIALLKKLKNPEELIETVEDLNLYLRIHASLLYPSHHFITQVYQQLEEIQKVHKSQRAQINLKVQNLCQGLDSKRYKPEFFFKLTNNMPDQNINNNNDRVLQNFMSMSEEDIFDNNIQIKNQHFNGHQSNNDHVLSAKDNTQKYLSSLYQKVLVKQTQN